MSEKRKQEDIVITENNWSAVYTPHVTTKNICNECDVTVLSLLFQIPFPKIPPALLLAILALIIKDNGGIALKFEF